MSQINESAIKTPGVYVNEIPAFPPSVAQVATAIPCFIGYTPQAVQNGNPVYNTAVRISSLIEFTTYFGTGFSDLQANVILSSTGTVNSVYFNNKCIASKTKIGFQLFNAIQMFFNNGGSNCYIIAIKPVKDTSPAITDFMPVPGPTCFDVLQKKDEPTLIVIPDAVLLDINGFNNLMNAALDQCGHMQDRFTIMDIYDGYLDYSTGNDVISTFRNDIIGQSLNYGAAYYPWLKTSLPYSPSNPNNVSYSQIVYFKPDGSSPPGSSFLNSPFANQLELATSDMKTIINPFINDPFTFLSPPVPFSPPSINTSSMTVGFGLIPQTNDQTELTNKLSYIDDLLAGFIGLNGFTDNQPSINSTQGIFNKYTKPGTPASVSPPATVVYSPIEQFLAELYLLNESWPQLSSPPSSPPSPPGTGLISNLASITKYLANINSSNISYSQPIYGFVPLASPPTTIAYEVSFIRSRVQTLYNNVVNYINGFYSDVANYINGLEIQLIAASPVYANIKTAIANQGLTVPPSGAMAGIYAAVDASRGVWKSPANVNINTVVAPTVAITDNMQEGLNIDTVSGKSVNAIRAFTGKGVLVWGARTLTGNDNDFRYISVRRFYIMVEESVKLASYQFVFEPNDAKTWTRLRAIIENYLTNLWRLGALAGAKPEAAFWVKVGLGQTMTFDDILNGKLIVEIGMAPVRPAEFIILRFTQIQQTS